MPVITEFRSLAWRRSELSLRLRRSSQTASGSASSRMGTRKLRSAPRDLALGGSLAFMDDILWQAFRVYAWRARVKARARPFVLASVRPQAAAPTLHCVNNRLAGVAAPMHSCETGASNRKHVQRWEE